MTLFKQIVGRGTRIRWEDGKTSFTIMDFRDVTRLFADPEWDGPIEQAPGFAGEKGGDGTPFPEGVAEGDETGTYGGADSGTAGGEREPRTIPFVREDGCKVFATTKTVSIYDTNGKLLKQESIVDYTRENVQGQYGTLDKFIHTWSTEEKKKAIAEALAKQGIDLDQLKRDMSMGDVDDYDFICHVAYDQKPLTRRERAESVKKRDFLHRFSGAANRSTRMRSRHWKTKSTRQGKIWEI